MSEIDALIHQIRSHTIVVVVGIGTDVGKTVATGFILGQLRALGIATTSIKWVQTGCSGGRSDVSLHESIARCYHAETEPTDGRVVYQFELPASPHLAAETAGKSIEKQCVWTATKRLANHRLVLAETSGGVLVPMTRSETTLDWIVEWGWPVVLVTTDALGTLNHTTLTVRQLKAVGVSILGQLITPSTPSPGIIENDNRWMLSRLVAPTMVLPWIQL